MAKETIVVRKECYKCGYFTKDIKKYYKCFTKTCPAYQKREKRNVGILITR